MKEINELLDISYKNLEELKKKLGDLDNVHQDILDLKDAAIAGKESSDKIPKEFQKKFDDIKLLSEKYLKDIGISTNIYFDGNNKLFEQNQTDFKNKINDLHTKNEDLQDKISLLEIQIKKLSEIDLEGGFRELQDTLANIFKSINDINITLTQITQSLNGIVQTVGVLQNSINDGFKKTKEDIEKHLTKQDNDADKNNEFLINKIQLLSDHNALLKKEIKKNRIIKYVGFGLAALIILIYLMIKNI
ncbi:MAG: hypothetical protein HQ541_21395 [Mariniphaga sp.]|nr:hypothetical protein [Mariniphaga sp.]